MPLTFPIIRLRAQRNPAENSLPQDKGEFRAFTELAADRQAAVHHLEYTLRYTDADAGIIQRGRGILHIHIQNSLQLCQLFLGHANAGILYTNL